MSLSLFHPLVAEWFRQEIGEPSPPQQCGWPVIARGEHTLITAPTGAGKTLAAFLVAINDLLARGLAGSLGEGVQVLYVSPLKALNNDIYRNLEQPLTGILDLCRERGVACPQITRAVRTGDTPMRERQRMLRQPPHILITTPESLYLLLTSPKAKQMLSGVRYLIMDEIHALLDSKRGVHLALSVERLAAFAAQPFQRIGLSATVEPLAEAALFLGGGEPVADDWRARPVTIVAPQVAKQVDLQVQLPAGSGLAVESAGSVWPGIYQQVLDLVRKHRSTIVFVNNRAVAEKTAWNINQLAGSEIARAHHGSVSREVRLDIEQQLKSGQLTCLVATATLELGIDIGAVDLVVQIAAPKSVARGLQRLGRAGHRLDSVSKGRIIPRTRSDLLESTAIAREMLAGSLESLQVPQNSLDVLAQQVLAMASVDDWELTALWQLVRRAYPYRHLTLDELLRVIRMLSGEYEQQPDFQVRPRVIWDPAAQLISGDHYSRLLALSSGGTIPDRGYFPVYLPDGTTLLGELDEGFVFEARTGDRFMLGTAAWRIERIEQNRVIVSRSDAGGARSPYWTGEGLGRPYELGQRYGAFLREMAERVQDAGFAAWLKQQAPLGEAEALVLQRYLQEQIRALGGVLAHDRRLVVEHFSDDVGDRRVLIHSPFGGRVHAGLAMLLQQAVAEQSECQVEVAHNDDGVLLNILGGVNPPERLFSLLSPETAEEQLFQILPGTSMFSIAFRHNLARALMLGGKRHGQRSPLWIQRMRALEALQLAEHYADHPLVVETYRECLSSALDVPALLDLLRRVQQGEIVVDERWTEHPSPFSRDLLFQFSWVPMYEGVMPKPQRPERVPLSASERLRLRQKRQATSAGQARTAALPVAAWAKFLPAWQGVGRSQPASPEQLLTVIRQLAGLALPAEWWEDFIFPTRLPGYQAGWLDQLISTGQAFWRIRPGEGAPRLAWYTGDQCFSSEFSLPAQALGETEQRICRSLAEHGASWLQQLATATGLGSQALLGSLQKLIVQGMVVNDSFMLVRQALQQSTSGNVKTRARIRAAAYRPEMGRFALALPASAPSLDEQLERSLRRFGLFMYEVYRAEETEYSWGEMYDQVQRWELMGRVERGLYLEGQSGRQFATQAAVAELNRVAAERDQWQVLVACDPAQVYGWAATAAREQLSWARNPGTVLVTRDGQVVLVIERHGSRVSVHPELSVAEQVTAVKRFLDAWQAKRFWGNRRKLTITTWQDQPAAHSPLVSELRELGFWREMQDLVLWRKI